MSTQPLRRPAIGRVAVVLAALAFAVGPAAGPEPLPEPTLEALMEGMARTPGVIARFREVKELALLTAPLESRGTLYFAPPQRLARIVEEPGHSRLVIDGERLLFRDAAGGEEVDLSDNPIAREYVSNFIVLFNGDLTALRARYTPTFRTKGPRWTLELRPRRRPLSGFVEQVTLRGEGRVLTQMELVETDGDRTTTWFEEVEIDHRFDDTESEHIFGQPEPPAERP